MRRLAIYALALITGCSSTAVCSGGVGPETVTVDASSFIDQPGVVEVEVCVVPEDLDRDEAVCSPPGVATISYTTQSGDYPADFAFYVSLRTGESSFVIPEAGGGTHRMQCTPTTTNISLPVNP